MVKVNIGKRSLYLDGYLKSNLDIAKKVVKKDWDMVFIVDGVEGCGKSAFTQQCAAYLDNDFCLERIAMSPMEFKKSIKGAEKYHAVVYDEAHSGFSSRQSISFINKSLVSMLTQIRQKNLFVFIVMPCFFELDKYPAIWRSRALLHCYPGKGLQRGFFSFYNSRRKKFLYLKGKKFYQYCVGPNFRGRFTKGYMVDEKEYRAKKLEALSYGDLYSSVNNRFIQGRNSLITVCHELGWKQKEIAEAIERYSRVDMDRRTVSEIILETRKKFCPEEIPDEEPPTPTRNRTKQLPKQKQKRWPGR